jgi:hypothetical protein
MFAFVHGILGRFMGISWARSREVHMTLTDLKFRTDAGIIARYMARAVAENEAVFPEVMDGYLAQWRGIEFRTEEAFHAVAEQDWRIYYAMACDCLTELTTARETAGHAAAVT